MAVRRPLLMGQLTENPEIEQDDRTREIYIERVGKDPLPVDIVEAAFNPKGRRHKYPQLDLALIVGPEQRDLLTEFAKALGDAYPCTFREFSDDIDTDLDFTAIEVQSAVALMGKVARHLKFVPHTVNVARLKKNMFQVQIEGEVLEEHKELGGE